MFQYGRSQRWEAAKDGGECKASVQGLMEEDGRNCRLGICIKPPPFLALSLSLSLFLCLSYFPLSLSL